MDETQSVVLIQTYFCNPDYVVVQCLVHATFLFPHTVNQMEPHVYHSVKFFPERVGYIPLCTPCDHIVAIIDHSNVEMPFVYSTASMS